MSRPTEQTMKCLRRDLDWLSRIKKRARDNETRSPRVYAKILKSLTEVMDIFQRELDEDAKRSKRVRVDSGVVRRQAAQDGTGAVEVEA